MLSFSTMWNIKRLSGEDLEKIKASKPCQSTAIPLESVCIHDGTIDFHLVVQSTGTRHLDVSIFAKFPNIVEYIAGYFGVFERGRCSPSDNCSNVRMMRWCRLRKQNEHVWNRNFRKPPLIDWDPETTKGLCFEYYLDVQQIKFWDNARLDMALRHIYFNFDATHVLQKQCHHRWIIKDDKMKQLKQDQMVDADCCGGWTFQCGFSKRYTDVTNTRLSTEQLRLDLCLYRFPLDVSGFEVYLHMDYQHNGKKICDYLTYDGKGSLKLSVCKSDIFGEDEFRLNVGVWITKVFDSRRKEIPFGYWKRYGIA